MVSPFILISQTKWQKAALICCIKGSYALDRKHKACFVYITAFRTIEPILPGLWSAECDADSSDWRRNLSDPKQKEKRSKKLAENETATYIDLYRLELQVSSNTSAELQLQSVCTSDPLLFKIKNKNSCCCLSASLHGGFVFLCLLSFMRIL